MFPLFVYLLVFVVSPVALSGDEKLYLCIHLWTSFARNHIGLMIYLNSGLCDAEVLCQRFSFVYVRIGVAAEHLLKAFQGLVREESSAAASSVPGRPAKADFRLPLVNIWIEKH